MYRGTDTSLRNEGVYTTMALMVLITNPIVQRQRVHVTHHMSVFPTILRSYGVSLHIQLQP